MTVAPVPVWGVEAESLEDLVAALETTGGAASGSFLAADVSLRAWRGHQVATELCGQLGLEPPHQAWPSTAAPHGKLSYADLVGRGIDAEARGDEAALTALDAADRVVAAIGSGSSCTVVVVAPRYGLAWEPEDLLFIRLLARRLEPTTGQLALVYADSPESSEEFSVDLSVEWVNRRVLRSPSPSVAVPGLIALIPGIVDRGVEIAIAAADPGRAGRIASLPLPGGRFLVAPECRCHPRSVSRLDYDRLGAALPDTAWLRAYAQCLGNNAFVDAAFLTTQAWRRFAEGGGGIALRLLERAADCARDTAERAVAQFQAQGIRIAMKRSAEIVGMPDPSPAVPPELRAFLLLAKGYGLVMTGEVDRAQAPLTEAQALLEGHEDDREYLYLLNIAALGRLKSGDPEGALAIEREIATRTKSSPRPDWRLGYVNSVNIARLSRRLGDLETARDSYSEAFATTLGSRSESEAVYTNFCLARVEAERGQHHEAFLCWLRAALHWASARAPEALGRRVTAALLGESPTSPHSCVEDVSEALASSLEAAAREARLPVIGGADRFLRGDVRPVAFVRADAPRVSCAPQPLAALGKTGWGVLVAPELDGVTAAEPEATRRLRAVVAELLGGLTGASGLFESGTVIVDDRLGQEIAASPYELVETALRLRGTTLSFEPGGRLELDEQTRARLESGLHVRLGGAVDIVAETGSGITVSFKRGLDDVRLPVEHAPILRVLEDQPPVGELAARLGMVKRGASGLLSRLRLLEAARIVYLSCSEETFTTVGISWPSRAI